MTRRQKSCRLSSAIAPAWPTCRQTSSGRPLCYSRSHDSAGRFGGDRLPDGGVDLLEPPSGTLQRHRLGRGRSWRRLAADQSQTGTMRKERFMRLAKRNAPLLFAQAQHFASTSNIVIVILLSFFAPHVTGSQYLQYIACRKYLMALTGAGLFGFVVMHGNLTIFAGQAAINEYAAKLHSLGLCSGRRNWVLVMVNSHRRRQIVLRKQKSPTGTLRGRGGTS